MDTFCASYICIPNKKRSLQFEQYTRCVHVYKHTWFLSFAIHLVDIYIQDPPGTVRSGRILRPSIWERHTSASSIPPFFHCIDVCQRGHGYSYHGEEWASIWQTTACNCFKRDKSWPKRVVVASDRLQRHAQDRRLHEWWLTPGVSDFSVTPGLICSSLLVASSADGGVGVKTVEFCGKSLKIGINQLQRY